MKNMCVIVFVIFYIHMWALKEARLSFLPSVCYHIFATTHDETTKEQ